MRAIIIDSYGPPEVAAVREAPEPAPRDGEVVVDLTAVAVTAGDARMRSGVFPSGFGLVARLAVGLRGPRRRILGSAFAGRCDGERVAGMAGARLGAHAERLAVAADSLVRIPEGVGDAAAAAALFGRTTALHFLRDRARLRPGERLLVNGASGSVGSAAVQLGRALGAEVTAVTSAANAELAAGLGADRVVDYGRTPVGALDERFDVVLDAVGGAPRREWMRLLAPGGRLVLVAAGLGDTIAARGPVIAGVAAESPELCADVLRYVEEGGFDPLVEELGGLDAVSEAYRRIDSRRKVGNLVVDPRC
ncbi:MAG: NAD(P)-dependent alcohol dehydrogenase [Microbacteriaceae bacterium]|nr:NAD(P)-dependent alcohol dehydrogenase [Microbacteriaceae bacterium]